MTIARKLNISIVAAAAALAALAPSSQAASQSTASIPCPVAPIEQPFLAWSDLENYWLTPGGGFETGTPKWTLANSKAVSGNETYKVHGTTDAYSLSLADKGTALSPVFCLTNNTPTMRFFVRSGKV